MGKHSATSKKVTGGVMLGAVASGLAAAAMSGAGTANATCASISGINNGGGCTSTPTSFAVGLGDNTTATANGLFTGAVAIGLDNGAADTTVASSTGALSLALAVGKNTRAVTNGNLGFALAQGTGATAANPVTAQAGATAGDNLNIALNVFGKSVNAAPIVGGVPDNSVFAFGQGNVAANIGGSSTAARPNWVHAVGGLNGAFNLGGDGNVVQAGSILGPTPSTAGLAFNAFGNNNNVTAVGPVAIAGNLGQDSKTVTQIGPGININNI